jgi:glycosyltransferase involved in cell wall biosynthesis
MKSQTAVEVIGDGESTARPKISVVIPAYNRAQLLKECLESIIQQSYPAYEVIVVDDGSQEDLSAVKRQFGSPVRIIRQVNQGQAVARNTGIDSASGEYIAFLDSDDVWFPWTLSIFHQVVQRYDHPSLIMGKPCKFHADEELKGIVARKLDAQCWSDELEALAVNASSFVGSGAVVVKRSALNGGIRFRRIRNNAEDLDFLLRLSTAGPFVVIHEPVTFGYRQHEVSDTRNLASTIRGVKMLIDCESRAEYPGGRARRHDRRTTIARWSDDWQRQLIRRRLYGQAMLLYLKSFRLYFSAARWRGLVRTPRYIARKVISNTSPPE